MAQDFIENIDPLTTGQTMYGEDIKALAGTKPEVSQHNPGLPVPGSSDKPNKSKLAQLKVAKSRMNKKG